MWVSISFRRLAALAPVMSPTRLPPCMQDGGHASKTQNEEPSEVQVKRERGHVQWGPGWFVG